jgi:hypothetical protein
MVPVRNCDLWQRVDRALRFHKVDCGRWRIDGPHLPDQPPGANRCNMAKQSLGCESTESGQP